MKKSAELSIVLTHFLILMSSIVAIVVLIVFFIYKNAINVMKEEICNVNMNQTSQVENNMIGLVERADRLASAICVQKESLIYWESVNPEKLDADFYTEMGSQFMAYIYSMNDFLYSVSIYSPEYKRFLQEGMTSPYILKDEKSNVLNYEWIPYMQEMKEIGTITSVVNRAINGNYPYVMTIIKQYSYMNGWGAVAVDINLEKAYNAVWPHAAEDISIWVLDENGQVLIRNGKNELFGSVNDFQELTPFEKKAENYSLIWEDGEEMAAYSQRYLEEYGLYFVAVSKLEDFQIQMRDAKNKALGAGILCIFIFCLLAWIYVNLANRPLQKILGMLRDPVNFHGNSEKSNKEVREIVDRIVSNIQTNEALRNELEERLDILRQTQLQALKAQINPHFLFNTLNVIVTLIDAEIDDSIAAQVTADLAAILHYALSDDDLVPLYDELEHTRKFIYILEQRYKYRFKAQIDIAPELLEIKVPKLILQPLIENALFHGIVAKQMSQDGLLVITGCKIQHVFEKEQMWAVQIDVEDNGKGMSQEEIDSLTEALKQEHISMEHIGVRNVAKRLALLFPQKSEITVKSALGEGTRVSLFFPYEERI